MTDKELLYQMLDREISNLLGGFSPALKGFSGMVTNYVIRYIDPYVDAFISGGKINTSAASEYLKDETNKKIEEYMNRFKLEQKELNNDL